MKAQEIAGDETTLRYRKKLFYKPGRQLWRYLILRCLLFVCAVVVLASCIVTPEHGLLEGRGEIDDSDILLLEEGKSTSEEVLLKFGEPDLILHDQRTLVYHWQVVRGYKHGGYTGAYTLSKDYLFILEFDGEGRLKRVEKRESTRPDAIIIIDPLPAGIMAQPSTPSSTAQSISFSFGELRDQRDIGDSGTTIIRQDKIFSLIVSEVRTFIPVTDILKVAIKSQMEAAGYYMVNKDADVMLTVEVMEFGVTESKSVWESVFDIIGSLDVILKVDPSTTIGEPIIRRYKAKHTSNALLEPSREHFERVMRACIEDMQRQIASDTDLVRLINGNRP